MHSIFEGPRPSELFVSPSVTTGAFFWIADLLAGSFPDSTPAGRKAGAVAIRDNFDS